MALAALESPSMSSQRCNVLSVIELGCLAVSSARVELKLFFKEFMKRV